MNISELKIWPRLERHLSVAEIVEIEPKIMERMENADDWSDDFDVMGMFTWFASPDGYEYWSKLSKRVDYD